jgi:spoIIIJ-associated protein
VNGFLSKLFGGKKEEAGSDIVDLVENSICGIFENGQFDLKYSLSSKEGSAEEPGEIKIDIFGPDENLMKEKDGAMIDSLQLFLKRVVQHHFPEDQTNVVIDCGGFKEESEQALIDLAERFKVMALEKNKSVYIRALPPRERKVVHQYLSVDARVKSRSIGDGLFKKIKIYPVKEGSEEKISS